VELVSYSRIVRMRLEASGLPTSMEPTLKERTKIPKTNMTRSIQIIWQRITFKKILRMPLMK